jgi:hypothetical protein
MMDEPAKRSERCYLSTPRHASTFYGKYMWIYTDKGCLQLSRETLRFDGKRNRLEIALHSIDGLHVGRFHRAAKPDGLDRIEVTYRTQDGRPTVYLVPTQSPWTPTWETNKIVADWFTCIDQLRPPRDSTPP